MPATPTAPSWWPWNREMIVEAERLLAAPWRGNAARRARLLLAAAVGEIRRLERERAELQRQLDNETFRGAVIGPGGNLGPADD